MIDPCPLPVHHWWQWYPPVGTFIGFLACLGVIVPWLFRPIEKMGRSEKAIWTLVMIMLVGLEIRTLYLDRDEHDREQSQARCQQLQSFREIATTLGTAITTSQIQFDKTMKGVDKVFDKTNQAADLAKEGIAGMTGSDSYLFIYPHGTLSKSEQDQGKFLLLVS